LIAIVAGALIRRNAMNDPIHQAIAKRDARALRNLAEQAPSDEERMVLWFLADLIDANYGTRQREEKVA
jgi:hypothetical protein